MAARTPDPQRLGTIRALFDEYLELYAARDEALTAHFSENFSGYAGSGDRLVKDRDEWVGITRQDYAQVPGRIRFELLDISLQDLSADVVLVTAFVHMHLPTQGHLLEQEVARLALVFRLEGEGWKIVHNSYSIPFQRVQSGEVFPIKSLAQRTHALEAMVEERTRELQLSQALYRMLAEDTLDVIWKTDRNLVITYISPSDQRLRGFEPEEVIGRSVFGMFTDEGVNLVKRMLKQGRRPDLASEGNGFITFEVQHRCKDGRLIWGEVLSKPDRDAQGEIVGYHGITREITRRKALEEQVRQLALHDTLTRLANRRLLMDHLGQTLSACKRKRQHGALLFLDLDNFKPLNDSHGHAAGDLLLIEVAARLKACVREADTVARIGGDEFVVLLSELSLHPDHALAQACAIAQKILDRLSAPYLLQAKTAASGQDPIEHHCTASIGVVVFDGQATSEEDVIDRADAAMYRAKACLLYTSDAADE